MDWAATQNNLGNALTRLGAWTENAARLQEAAGAYRAALEERTRERAPMGWAATQDNLGKALRNLGVLTGDAARLQEAAGAYRAALEEHAPKSVRRRSTGP